MTGQTTEAVDVRHQMVTTVIDRLGHLDKLRAKGETFTVARVAALIVDDLMASPGMGMIIDRTTMNGLDSGHERGLNEAIAAVGAMERYPDKDGEYTQVNAVQAQKAIRGRSKREQRV